MNTCNEGEGQSGAHLNNGPTPTISGAAATAITPAIAPSKTPQTELIEVPAPAIASAVSPIESEKTDAAKTDSLGTPPSKSAIEPAMPNIKASETEALK